MGKLKENVVYEFAHCIPMGWYEISVKYKTDIFGKKVKYIKCISEKPKEKGLRFNTKMKIVLDF